MEKCIGMQSTLLKRTLNCCMFSGGDIKKQKEFNIKPCKGSEAGQADLN